eukprot:3691102-Amphidinium_carterae.1
MYQRRGFWICPIGAVPKWMDAQALFISHNHLAGSIPQQLLGGWDPLQKAVVANQLLLEGTIPESASRMTVAEIILSFGHGLRGLLPSIQGTVTVLSLWENSLEGHLPDLHINERSVLLVHANEFSCKLPRNGE